MEDRQQNHAGLTKGNLTLIKFGKIGESQGIEEL